MNVKELIASEFPSLTLQDTGERALHLMHEFHVLHLPLVQRDSYVALVSEEDILDWDTPEQPLSLAEFLQFRPAVNETAHPFDAVRLARQHQLSVIPVVNEHHHFAGVVPTGELFRYVTDQEMIQADGAVLVIDMDARQYSLAELAHLCEANDTRILGLHMRSKDDQLELTIRVNSRDVQALGSTLERYGYAVRETYTTVGSEDSLQHNLDAFMHYISL